MKRIFCLLLCAGIFFGISSEIFSARAASRTSWAIEPTRSYDDVEYFENDTYVFSENGKKGLVNSKGEVLAEAKYDDFFRCSCGAVFTDAERKKALILSDGYTVVSESEATAHPDYYGFYAYSDEKILIVSVGDKTTAKNAPTDGALTFEKVTLYTDRKNGGYDPSKTAYSGVFGYRTSDGEVFFDGTLEGAVGFENGLAAIKKDGKWAYIDETGKMLTDFVYSDTKVPNHLHDEAAVYLISEGFIPVCRDGKWGYIDRNGKELTDFIYEKTTPVCGSRAWVKSNGKWGILDLSKVALPVEKLTVLGFLSDSGIYVGKSLAINYAVEPASAEVFWKSSDENVVTVSSDGTATFISVGTAVVSAVDAEGNVLSNLAVEVKEPPSGNDGSLSKDTRNTLFFVLGTVFGVLFLVCAAMLAVSYGRNRKNIKEKTDDADAPSDAETSSERTAESAADKKQDPSDVSVTDEENQ